MGDELSELEARVVAHLERTLRPGFCPSLEELSRAAGLGSRGYRITQLLEGLEERGFLCRTPGQSRSITLLRRTDGRPFSFNTVWAPIVGLIGASRPRETAVQQDNPFAGEAVELTRGLLRGHDDVMTLVVSGDSMIEASINDGDIVVIAPSDEIHNGDMVAASVAGEGRTLKYYYRQGRQVELRPANATMPSLKYHPHKVTIEGKVILVIRQLMSPRPPTSATLAAAA
jgi:repressor LexA